METVKPKLVPVRSSRIIEAVSNCTADMPSLTTTTKQRPPMFFEHSNFFTLRFFFQDGVGVELNWWSSSYFACVLPSKPLFYATIY